MLGIQRDESSSTGAVLNVVEEVAFDGLWEREVELLDWTVK